MILANDVYYLENNRAKSVNIIFDDWQAEAPTFIEEVLVDNIAPYEPGSFYKRELPCILKVLEKTDLKTLSVIIVDGYVVLDDNGKKGLGAYLYEALDGKIPVIGVAKRSFHQNQKNVIEVIRGESQNPLYITSIGTDLNEAALNIKKMKGNYRIPTLLKLLDTKTRQP